MEKTSCAFTGHRPHKFPWKLDETDPRCTALKTVLIEQIFTLAENGVTDFFSGMADGTDCWASMAVLKLREQNSAIRLHGILPCKDQADQWNRFAKERYCQILKQADSIVSVSPYYRDGCMLERNRLLVDSASILLAVYNGEYRGGTAATIRYAQK